MSGMQEMVAEIIEHLRKGEDTQAGFMARLWRASKYTSAHLPRGRQSCPLKLCGEKQSAFGCMAALTQCGWLLCSTISGRCWRVFYREFDWAKALQEAA